MYPHDDRDRQSLSIDLFFDVLKNQRRRYALEFLIDADEQVQLSHLAKHVAARENDTTVDELSSAERKRVYTALYQTHLPKLDDAGMVNYKKKVGRVSIERHASTVDQYLERLSGWDESEKGFLFDVLKNQRRRYALEFLIDADEQVQLNHLAKHVAARENDTAVDELSSAERKRVYTSLYQSHLTKLDEAGIVDYDRPRGIVRPVDATSEYDPRLDDIS